MFLKRVAAALVVASFAAVAQAGKPQTGAEAAANAAPDDVICTYEQSVGSHIKRRTCATRAAREEQAKRDQEAMREANRRGRGYGRASEPAGP